MSESSDTTAPRRRNRRRKAPAEAVPPAEPAVRAILEQALHPDPATLDAEVGDVRDASPERPPEPADKPARRRRKAAGKSTEQKSEVPPAPRKRRRRAAPPVQVETERADDAVAAEAADIPAVVAAPSEAADAGPSHAPAPVADWPDAAECWSPDHDIAVAVEAEGDPDVREGEAPRQDAPEQDVPGSGDASPDEPLTYADVADANHVDPDPLPPDLPDPGDPDVAGGGPPPPAPPAHAHAPVPHGWVYLAVGLFLTALGFGVWGVWNVFFTDGDAQTMAAVRTRADRLSQEVSTLRRSDQISRDANRDLERTLAERDEEIASLRADIAFYERFVGATGQRRGLSVHTLEMHRQDGDAWHFVATLTQNVNRGAVNDGRLTLSVEGTRGDRMEKLAWAALRKQPNAPGQPYSFKYFQQLEGEVLLPADFKPLRVTVRLVPQSGSAVEQSFPWPETLHSAAGG